MSELLHPGRGDAWWCEGDRLVVALEGQLWRREGGWMPFQASSPLVLPDVRPSERTSLAKLPLGARKTAPLLGVPGVFWRHEGCLYRLELGRGPEVVGWVDGDVQPGTLGAVAGGSAAITWVAAPRRSRHRLALPLQKDTLRWSRDGLKVAGMSPEGAVLLSTVDGRLVARLPGVPVDTEGTVLAEAAIRREGRVLQWGVCEASWSRLGRLLAGPGGVIWDLHAARPLFEHPGLTLGGTVLFEERAATAHWETGEGWWCDLAGRRSHPFQLPLEADDVVVSAMCHAAQAVFFSAFGGAWSVSDGHVQDAAVDQPEEQDAPEHEGFVWSTDGYLFRR